MPNVGALKGRTIVLTTHHVKHIPRCDFHLALNIDGSQQSFAMLDGQSTHTTSSKEVDLASKSNVTHANQAQELVKPHDT